MSYKHDHAGQAAFAQRLRRLMSGPPKPDTQLEAIQGIVNERIDALNAKQSASDGTASEPVAEP